MRISEYVCKTCLKELTIFLKCGGTFEIFLKLLTFLKILVFHMYFDLFQNSFSPFQQVYLYDSNSSGPVIGKSNKGTLSM